MNRTDLQHLAEMRLREAAALRTAGEWSGAYYIAGYAVECGIKACIAKMTDHHEFPDKARTDGSYSHNIENLLKVAKFDTQKKDDSKTNTKLKDHWATAQEWNESTRYQQKTRKEADELFIAITDPNDGVFQWFKLHW